MTKESIIEKIQNQSNIEFIFYENNESINQLIKYAIEEVLKNYGRSDIAGPIYGCIKELVINATKANLKRVFFIKNNLDINNMGDYVKGLVQLKKEIEQRDISKYYEPLRKMDLWVMLVIHHNPDGIQLEVINNTEIIDIENKRIRMKLNKAMNYTEIANFYLQEHDESEGAGLGIALLVLLMRSARLDPNLFRIGNIDNHTIARIEIPLTDNYKPVRKL